MKKLFTVTLETEIVVLADTQEEAEEHAREADLSTYDYDFRASEMRHMPGGSDADSIGNEGAQANENGGVLNPAGRLGTWFWPICCSRGGQPTHRQHLLIGSLGRTR